MSIRRYMSGLSPTPSFLESSRSSFHQSTFPPGRWHLHEALHILSISNELHRSKTLGNRKEKLTRYSVSSLPKGGSTKFKIQRGPRGMLSEVHKYVNRTSTKWRPTSIVVASFHAYLPQCQASMSKDCLSLGVKKLQHSDNSKIWIKTSGFASGTLTRGSNTNVFWWFFLHVISSRYWRLVS